MATLKKAAEAKQVKEEVKTEAKATKAAAKAEKKAAPKAEKKVAAKKSPAKKADTKKEKIIVQYGGKEYDADAVVEAAKADFKANNKGCLRSINVYIKPEDNAAYYVVNGKVEGKVSL